MQPSRTEGALKSGTADYYSMESNTQAVCVVAKPKDGTVMSGTGTIIVDDAGNTTFGGNSTASALCGNAVPNPFPDPSNDVNPKPAPSNSPGPVTSPTPTPTPTPTETPTPTPPEPSTTPISPGCEIYSSWNANTDYPGKGEVVSWQNVIYKSVTWSRNSDPSTHYNHGDIQGQAWNKVGDCQVDPSPTPTTSPSPTINPNPYPPGGDCKEAYDQFVLGKAAGQRWAKQSDFNPQCTLTGSSYPSAVGHCNNPGFWVGSCSGNCNSMYVFGGVCGAGGNCNSLVACSDGKNKQPVCVNGNCTGNGDIWTLGDTPYKVCTGGCQSMTVHYPKTWSQMYPNKTQLQNILCDNGKCDLAPF